MAGCCEWAPAQLVGTASINSTVKRPWMWVLLVTAWHMVWQGSLLSRNYFICWANLHYILLVSLDFEGFRGDYFSASTSKAYDAESVFLVIIKSLTPALEQSNLVLNLFENHYIKLKMFILLKKLYIVLFYFLGPKQWQFVNLPIGYKETPDLVKTFPASSLSKLSLCDRKKPLIQ